jgi:hypothetical protein
LHGDYRRAIFLAIRKGKAVRFNPEAKCQKGKTQAYQTVAAFIFLRKGGKAYG